MPRIRTIKPEFWTDPVIVRLSPLARLFYIGTWNFALCDQGHLEDDPFRLKLQILPAENCDAQALIDELVDAGRLARVTVDGDAYLHVRTLADHQKVDGRWTPRCPVCKHLTSPKLPETPASLVETHRDSPNHTAVKEGNVKEGKEETSDESDEFAVFYSLYPRREKKGAAERAWKAAVKKTDADTILEALRRRLPLWANTERRFIPLPATWLNGESWEDELDDDPPTLLVHGANPFGAPILTGGPVFHDE